MHTCWLTCISEVLRPHSPCRSATVNTPANRRMRIASVDIAKQPQQNDLVLKFDKLPDFITSEQLSKLMNWTKSTIDTKHSRGELAGVTGTDLTPKQGLMDYIEKRTKGVIQKPEEWFDKEILKKPKKAKSIK